MHRAALFSICFHCEKVFISLQRRFRRLLHTHTVRRGAFNSSASSFFFCLRSFREQDGTGSGVRAGENSWCCSLEKQLALDTWPVLHCTVRPTEEPSPGDRPRLPRPTSLHPPPPLAAVIERGFEIVFFVLFFFKPCVFPRCNLKPVVNNQNGERWEGFP